MTRRIYLTDSVPKRGGIRVQHTTARNTRFSVVEPQPYEKPYVCPKCRTTHQFKTHHLDLDETGAAIVSPGVYERIRGTLALNGFRLANAVEKPPTITFDAGARIARVERQPVVSIGHAQENYRG
jgi:hypothetical protein